MKQYLSKAGMTPLYDNACTEDVLSEFEAGLCNSLPEEYRRFLREWNGCLLDGSLGFCVALPWGEKEHLPVGSLFGLANEPDFRDLRVAGRRLEFQQRVPENILAIGETPYRQFLCISLRGDDRGIVYLWDPSEDWEDGPNVPTYEHLTPIAPSFREFFESIRELPER